MIDFKISLLKQTNTILTFVLALVLGIFVPFFALGSLGFHDIEGTLAICILVASLIFGVLFARYVVKWEKQKMENKGAIIHLALFLILLTGIALPSLFTYVIH